MSSLGDLATTRLSARVNCFLGSSQESCCPAQRRVQAIATAKVSLRW